MWRRKKEASVDITTHSTCSRCINERWHFSSCRRRRSRKCHFRFSAFLKASAEWRNSAWAKLSRGCQHLHEFHFLFIFNNFGENCNEKKFTTIMRDVDIKDRNETEWRYMSQAHWRSTNLIYCNKSITIRILWMS